jgi:hypothetical protein
MFEVLGQSFSKFASMIENKLAEEALGRFLFCNFHFLVLLIVRSLRHAIWYHVLQR